MKNLIFILLTLVTNQVYTQQVTKTFGNFSEEEINMTAYEEDEDAKAVVLYDKGISEFHYFNSEYDIRFTRHKRVKIFDKSIEGQAEVSIPYYKDGLGKTEVIEDIVAITYNHENGMPIMKKVDPKTIYDEQLSEKWHVKKFVFPDIQDGSILEYKYVHITPFLTKLPDWIFQDDIPTLYSEYEVGMIPFYEYVFLAQGITEFDYEKTQKSTKRRKWQSTEYQTLDYAMALKNVPAFKSQDYISSKDDYLIKIDFQLSKVITPDGRTREILSSWNKLNENLLKRDKEFGLYIKGAKKYANYISQELKLGQLSKQEKAEKIINYVKSSFEWNGIYGKYATQTPKEFYTKKTGSVADINLFTIALLNEAGVEAEPLLLSTRNHGKLRTDYAFIHMMNYVIIIGQADHTFLADATEDLLPYNRIPTRCVNDKGLIVNEKEEVEWISLESNINSLEKKSINMVLNPESMDIDTKISIQSTGYESYYNRTYFKNDTTKIKDYYEEKVGDINRMKSINYNKNFATPYSIFLVGNCETEKLGDKIIVKPFLKLPMAENVLEEEERNYPVDFIYANNDEYVTNLQIPNTHTINSLPDDYSISDDLVDLSVSYSFENNSMTAKGNANFKKAVYSVEDYPKLREHFEMMVKYFNQAVVVEKAN